MKKNRLLAIFLALTMVLTTILPTLTSAEAFVYKIFPPSAPTNVLALKGDGKVTLTWTAGSGLNTSFFIDRTDDNWHGVKPIATVDGNTYTYVDYKYSDWSEYRIAGANSAGATYSQTFKISSYAADLSSISLDSGNLAPAFTVAQTFYTATCQNSSIKIMPKASCPVKAIVVNDSVVADGAWSENIPLNIGANTIKIEILSLDMLFTKSYTIEVTRTDPAASQTVLSALALDSGTLSPALNDATTYYTASTDSSSIKVVTTTAFPSKTIMVNGSLVASGAWSQSIPLNVGANTITIVVTALDGKTTETHTIVVTRETAALDYSSASPWAVSELKQAQTDNLTTGRVMSGFTQNITREEFCGLAVKLYEALSGKQALPVANNPFTDTSDIDVLKAVNLGIVYGVSENAFAPNANITRQEICVMIFRALQDAKPGLDFSTTGVGKFTDENLIAAWALDAVRFASKQGIMKGPGNNTIDPLSNTSREQGIILIKRTFENLS